MESATLRSETIKKDIEVFQHRCDMLTSRFETAEGVTEKTKLADEYGRAVKQVESLQFLLELVERQERARAYSPSSR